MVYYRIAKHFKFECKISCGYFKVVGDWSSLQNEHFPHNNYITKEKRKVKWINSTFLALQHSSYTFKFWNEIYCIRSFSFSSPTEMNLKTFLLKSDTDALAATNPCTHGKLKFNAISALIRWNVPPVLMMWPLSRQPSNKC